MIASNCNLSLTAQVCVVGIVLELLECGFGVRIDARPKWVPARLRGGDLWNRTGKARRGVLPLKFQVRDLVEKLVRQFTCNESREAPARSPESAPGRR